MSTHINRALKEIIIVLSGCVGYANALKDLTFHGGAKAKRSIAAMGNHASKALDAISNELDQDQLAGVLRYARNSELMVIPKSSPRTKYDAYIVPAEVFDRLVMDPAGECAFCVKQGKEIKKCQRRRDLAACGIVTEGSKECPYQM